jgi:D-mannonate dehydratase
LLGDPQFPEFISDKGHRARTVLFRSLFETYSKLALTNLTDRSVAISGLESRFASTFHTEGRYDIFQCCQACCNKNKDKDLARDS